MGKKQRLKVLDVLKVADLANNDFTALVFKVQVGNNSEPMTMLYDQLKFTYPSALIEFYESQSEFFS